MEVGRFRRRTVGNDTAELGSTLSRLGSRPVDRVGVVLVMVACVGTVAGLMAALADPVSRVGVSPALLVPVAIAAGFAGRVGGLVVLVASVVAMELLVLPPNGILEADGLATITLAITAFGLVGAVVCELASRFRQQRQRLVHAIEDAERFQEVSSMAAEARARAESAKALLRLVSHELRTPLTILQFGSSTLAASESISASDRETARLMEAEAKELDDLIGNVVSMHRIDTGELAAERTEFDLGELVADVVYENSARRPVDQDWVVETGPVQVCGDPHLLRIAVRNLCHNVMKHAASAGRVTVCVTDTPPTVRIEDDGPGLSLSPESASEPFQRGPNSVGLGLGLSIVASIAEANDGAFELRPSPTGGVVAEIRLAGR